MSINMQGLDVSKYPDLAQKINETMNNEGARIVSDYAEIVELGLKCGLLYKRPLPPDQVGVHRKNRDGVMVCGRESSQIWDELDRVGFAPFRGGPPMNATMSKQEFKEAWAKDKLNEVVAKQAKDKLNEVVAKDKLNEVVAKQACKDAWANEAKAQASWAKAHGKEATNANGYLSIAEIRCDEKTKRIVKAHTCSKNSPPQSSK